MTLKTYVIALAFIGFDIITGYLLALKNRSINSTKLREGLFHKGSEILALVFSNLLEYVGNYVSLGVDVPLLEAVTVYICLTELVSILENLGNINPVLKKLYGGYLEKLHSKEVENNDNRD